MLIVIVNPHLCAEYKSIRKAATHKKQFYPHN